MFRFGDVDENRLTTGEIDVIALAGDGLSDGCIAGSLGIGLDVVKFRLKSARQKIGAANRQYAFLRAARQGMIPGVCMSMRFG